MSGTVDAFETDVEGLVRITAPPGVCDHFVAPQLRSLMRRHPKIRIQLDSTIGYADLTRCALDSATQGKVQGTIKKHLDLFGGVTDPEGKALFHVVGGVCGNSCGAQVAHGYRELSRALGGTLSGEHGVGLSKRPYVSKEIGPVEQGLMKQIKQVFDPHEILNPGKIFDM